MMRRRGSVPNAESMSANLATCSAFFLLVIKVYFYVCGNTVYCQVEKRFASCKQDWRGQQRMPAFTWTGLKNTILIFLAAVAALGWSYVIHNQRRANDPGEIRVGV